MINHGLVLSSSVAILFLSTIFSREQLFHTINEVKLLQMLLFYKINTLESYNILKATQGLQQWSR